MVQTLQARIIESNYGLKSYGQGKRVGRSYAIKKGRAWSITCVLENAIIPGECKFLYALWKLKSERDLKNRGAITITAWNLNRRDSCGCL